jgi:hypothetical protein
VAAEEGQQLLLGGNIWFGLKVEEDYWQRLRLWKNNGTWSDAVKCSQAELVNSMKWKCKGILCG